MVEIEKSLLHYAQGKGIDTSRIPCLQDREGVACLFKEPNSLYHFYPEDGIGYEAYDFVFNDGLLTETKYYRILIQEWFDLLSVGGNLIIRFKESNVLRGDNIDELFYDVVGDTGELLYVGTDEDSRTYTVVVQKISKALADDDDISKWTFGIINPSGNDLDRLISSIAGQNIPEYEILVFGPKIHEHEDIEIHWLGHAERLPATCSTAAIKNKLLLSAAFENVAIIDRRKADLILAKDWYEQAKRYGNHFTAKSCSLITETGERCADWWTLGADKETAAANFFQASKLGLLEYEDWDDWVYFADQACILKKGLYHKAIWDDRSTDGDENTSFSHLLRKKGVVMRINPQERMLVANAAAETLARNFPVYRIDHHRSGQRKRKLLRRTMWVIAEAMLKTGKFSWLTDSSKVEKIKKSRLYKLLVR